MDEAIYEADIQAKFILIDDIQIEADAPDTDMEMPAIELSATAVIIYTSGTTGSPKGVMLSYQNLKQNVESVSKYIPIYNPNSRYLCCCHCIMFFRWLAP